MPRHFAATQHNQEKGNTMIKQLEAKIKYQAQAYATLVDRGADLTIEGHERWGKLLGLCIAYKIAMGLETRVPVSLAHEFLEKAQVDLGYLDDEGYAA